MKQTFKILIILTFLLLNASSTWSQTEKQRLIILADMGNEPDEVQQMIHLLMYSNEIDIEGLISVTGIYLKPANLHPYRRATHPELFHQLIDAYQKVFFNLNQHADGWMSPFNLHVVVSAGQPEYGMSGVGEGKSTDGSNWIIEKVANANPRPIFIVANAGSNTLAQALYDYRKNHTPEEVMAFVAKIRVFENAAQDDAGAWINHEFPNIHWIRGLQQTKNFGGPSDTELGPHTWKPYAYTTKGQDNWAHENIRTGHGALGELYPMRIFFKHNIDSPAFLGGGGIIPWMSLVSHGLTDFSEPSWGGWSGRYTAVKKQNVPARPAKVQATEKQYEPWAVYTDTIDHWTDPSTGIDYNDVHTPIWPWRQAMYNDIQARMDWCVKPYKECNHHPVAVVNGDDSNEFIRQTATPGQVLSFDASASTDPDNDELRFYWWVYNEAGHKPYGKKIAIEHATDSKIKLLVPDDAAGKNLHLILEVWDKSKIVPLVDYRRVLISVTND